jgi:hypothetical protein
MYTERQLIIAAQVLIYLRKSRTDDPSQSVEEVLAKHEIELQEYAERHLGGQIPEENIYREVISGESIDARVEIKQVLTRVEDPNIKAVLVIDPQRLSRGDLGDCDRLIKALHLSHTKVLTPRGDYDLDNKRERKFFQDELLRGRDYYEYVREILYAGRVRAVKRGCYMPQFAPYGYKKIKIGKDYTLEIIEDQAEVVRQIFQWYGEEGMTPAAIARTLTSMGIPGPTGGEWSKITVRNILDNEHYLGLVYFNKSKATQVMENGEVVVRTLKQPAEEMIIAEGKHKAIIDRSAWDLVHDRIGGNPRVNAENGLQTPFAGMLYCGKCGKTLKRQPYKHAEDRYKCKAAPQCYRSVKESDIESAIIYTLEHVKLPELEAKLKSDDGDARKIQQKRLEKLEREMQVLREREEEQYDLLESRVYDRATFERRNARLREQMEKCQNDIDKTRQTLPKNVDFAERIVSLKMAIEALRDPEMPPKSKNRLLKTIVDKMVYTGSPRQEQQKGVIHNDNPFTLEIFLRL